MNILAFPRASVVPLLQSACTTFAPEQFPRDFVYGPRPDLEDDPCHVQLIAYAILRHRDGSVWAYQRTGGDGRLKGQKSVGVGGHVDEADQTDGPLETAYAALVRELQEELQAPPTQVPELPIGWIQEQQSEIGRCHIGLVWDVPWPDEVAPLPAEVEALASVGFLPPEQVTQANGFELWSELACQLIKK